MRSSRGLKGKRVGTEKQLDVNLTTPPHGVSLHSRQTVQHLNASYVSFNCRSFIFVRLLFSTSSSLFLFCSLIRYNLDSDLHVLIPATKVHVQPIPILLVRGTTAATAPAPKGHRTKLSAADAVAGLSTLISMISVLSELKALVAVWPVRKSVIMGPVRLV